MNESKRHDHALNVFTLMEIMQYSRQICIIISVGKLPVTNVTGNLPVFYRYFTGKIPVKYR